MVALRCCDYSCVNDNTSDYALGVMWVVSFTGMVQWVYDRRTDKETFLAYPHRLAHRKRSAAGRYA
jgi:hypothetical protein